MNKIQFKKEQSIDIEILGFEAENFESDLDDLVSVGGLACVFNIEVKQDGKILFTDTLYAEGYAAEYEYYTKLDNGEFDYVYVDEYPFTIINDFEKKLTKVIDESFRQRNLPQTPFTVMGRDYGCELTDLIRSIKNDEDITINSVRGFIDFIIEYKNNTISITNDYIDNLYIEVKSKKELNKYYKEILQFFLQIANHIAKHGLNEKDQTKYNTFIENRRRQNR